ncbi:MAG: hypothetical protein ACJ71Y_18490, partial [Blastococcus sp.]
VDSSRFTLSDAFKKAGWQTLSDVPSDTKPWAIGHSFYHFDRELNSTNVGYRGPRFSYARIPDQYTWAYFQQHELAEPHAPLMAEIDFVSSHTPWTPLPRMVPWDQLGTASTFDPMPAQGLMPSVAWRDPETVRPLYEQSIQYSLQALVAWVAGLHDRNLVLVLLGDHQPSARVSGPDANHCVPISVVAADPDVLSRIADWNWDTGLLPDPTAPVWRMDDFRDRFLTVFSNSPATSALGAPR